MKCADCKHWDDPYAEEWGYCRLSQSEDGSPLHPSTLACAMDTESYQATLNTHRDFGCVQFEKRDD